MWDLNSLARDWTHVPCIEKQVLEHWTTTSPHIFFFKNTCCFVPCFPHYVYWELFLVSTIELPLKALGEGVSLSPPASGGVSIPWVVTASLQSFCLCLHWAFSSLSQIPFCLSLLKIFFKNMVAENRGSSLAVVRGLLLEVASLAVERKLGHMGSVLAAPRL